MTLSAPTLSTKSLAPRAVFDTTGKGFHNPTKSLAPCKVHGKGFHNPTESTALVSSLTVGSTAEAFSSLVTVSSTTVGSTAEASSSLVTVSSTTEGTQPLVTVLQTSYGGGAADGPTLTGTPPKGDHGANRRLVPEALNSAQIWPAVRSNASLSSSLVPVHHDLCAPPVSGKTSEHEHASNQHDTQKPTRTRGGSNMHAPTRSRRDY